jgi:hypothetical protein
LARAAVSVLRVGAGVGLWRIEFKLGVVGKTSFTLKSRDARAIALRDGPQARTCNLGSDSERTRAEHKAKRRPNGT